MILQQSKAPSQNHAPCSHHARQTEPKILDVESKPVPERGGEMNQIGKVLLPHRGFYDGFERDAEERDGDK